MASIQAHVIDGVLHQGSFIFKKTRNYLAEMIELFRKNYGKDKFLYKQ